MMRRSSHGSIPTIAVALVLVCAAGTSAQTPGGPPQGARPDVSHVAVTADWQESFDAARQANNSEALSLLSRARTLLNQADNSRRRGDLAGAKASVDGAVLLIQRANQILRRAPGRSEQAGASLRDAETIMRNAMAQGAPPEQTAPIRSLMDQARRAQADGRHDVAVRLASAAQTQAHQVWQRSVTTRQLQQRCRVLESTVAPMVSRAREMASSGNDAVRANAERAQEHLRMAQVMNEPAQLATKARLLERAMQDAEAVFKAVDATGYSSHRALRAVDAAEAAISRAEEAASSDALDPGASADLRRGRALISRARQELATGSSEAARSLAEDARQTAQRILRATLGDVTETSVEEAIGQTDRLIELAARGSGERTAQLLAEARRRQEDARRLLAEGDLRRALAQTRIAARLAQRVVGP